MKKQSILFLLFTLFLAVNSYAQKVESISFRQSQSRITEPNMEVFVRPLIVDLEVVSTTRVEDTWSYPDVNIAKLSSEQLQNLKATALYQSSKKHEADVMVAAIFDIATPEKNNGFGVNITVMGYPAKYTNWRPAVDEGEYKWIQDVYGNVIGESANDATKAIK